MKNSFYFFDNLKRFLKLNKVMLLVISSLILLGFFTGVFVTLKLGENYCFDLIQNIALKKFLLKDIGFFGFLFFSILLFSCFILICFLFSLFKLGKILSICLIIYLTYLVGIDTVIIIKCLGIFRGIIFAIFGYLIWRFLLLFLLSIFCFKTSYYNNQLSCYGRCSIDKVMQKLILTFFIVSCLLILIEAIILIILVRIFVFI